MVDGPAGSGARRPESETARHRGSAAGAHEFPVRSVEAEHVTVERCAVGSVRSDRVRLRQSTAGALLARDTGLHQSGAWLVAGGRVTVERSGSQWLIGGVVEARQTFALAVIAGRVSGSVRCLLDVRGAAVFGVAFAITSFLLQALFRRR